MGSWRQGVLADIATARTLPQTFSVILAAVRTIGFESCAYGYKDPLPVSRPSFKLYCNYAKAWRQRYLAGNYFSRDPVVRYGLTHTAPLVWPVNPERAAFWEEARAYGLAYGWSQPIRHHDGRSAMLSVARGGDAISSDELAANEGRLAFLAHAGHIGMSRFVGASNMPPKERLTAREREVLKWTADGKTTTEISMILAVSERTITFHTVNIINKLGCRNKTQAVAKAALLGLFADIF